MSTWERNAAERAAVEYFRQRLGGNVKPVETTRQGDGLFRVDIRIEGRKCNFWAKVVSHDAPGAAWSVLEWGGSA